MPLISIEGSKSNCGAQLGAKTSSTVFIDGEAVGVKGDKVENEAGTPHDTQASVSTSVSNVRVQGEQPIVEGDSVAAHSIPMPDGSRYPHAGKTMMVNGSSNRTVFTGRST